MTTNEVGSIIYERPNKGSITPNQALIAQIEAEAGGEPSGRIDTKKELSIWQRYQDKFISDKENELSDLRDVVGRSRTRRDTAGLDSADLSGTSRSSDTSADDIVASDNFLTRFLKYAATGIGQQVLGNRGFDPYGLYSGNDSYSNSSLASALSSAFASNPMMLMIMALMNSISKLNDKIDNLGKAGSKTAADDGDELLPEDMRIGDGTIVDPTTGKEVPKAQTTEYIVKNGDTLSKIAANNNTTVDALKKANPEIKDVNSIKVGQKIKIPVAEAQQTSAPVDQGSVVAEVPPAPPAPPAEGTAAAADGQGSAAPEVPPAAPAADGQQKTEDTPPEPPAADEKDKQPEE